MENTTQANTTPSNGSTIKELITILKDGEIKDSILSLKTFTGMDIVKDKETQTPVISLYGTKKEETEDNQEEESQGNQGNNEESNEGKENPVDPQSNNESNEGEIIEEVLKLLGIDLPNHLKEATKKPMPVMKLSVPYSSLNDIFTDLVQKYLKANKLSVNAIKGDSEGKFIVMFSNKGAESKFLSDFIKEVEEYKGYTSMDAKNINVARALTNTEIKQIVDMLNVKLPTIAQEMLSDSKLQEALKSILGKYTLQFSIDSFIKKDKNISESAIKNYTRLQEEGQNLKVEPPFKKWTSGDVKEVAKQKKVSTLPVELEVKVTVTPLESQNENNQQSQQPQVQTVEESILSLLGINLPNHLKEANDPVPVENTNVQKKTTEETTPQDNNSTEQENTQPQGNTGESQNTDTKVLTLDSLKTLREYFVKYAQKSKIFIKTKENSKLINGLPVAFGNGKDKYLKVDQNGMTGLFTIQAALGEQSTLTNVANWAYKNKEAFTVKNDTSSVAI